MTKKIKYRWEVLLSRDKTDCEIEGKTCNCKKDSKLKYTISSENFVAAAER